MYCDLETTAVVWSDWHSLIQRSLKEFWRHNQSWPHELMKKLTMHSYLDFASWQRERHTSPPENKLIAFCRAMRRKTSEHSKYINKLLSYQKRRWNWKMISARWRSIRQGITSRMCGAARHWRRRAHLGSAESINASVRNLNSILRAPQWGDHLR